MEKKPEFNPEVTRVKLNPEQAVLACDCFDTGRKVNVGGAASGMACNDAGVPKNRRSASGIASGTITT